MTMKRFVQAAGITAVALFLMVASASATPIQYNTSAAGTVFLVSGGGYGSGTDTLLPTYESTGVTASLVFAPNPNYTAGAPTGINFGDFDIYCTGCSTLAQQNAFAIFPAFTFDLVVTNVTDGNATGVFVGTSSGTASPIYANSNPITINWVPVQLGPGTTNATGGTNFGLTEFQTSGFTQLVAPGSGCAGAGGCGDTTVQGTVLVTGGVPEPATFVLLGAGLLGLGFLRRKRA